MRVDPEPEPSVEPPFLYAFLISTSVVLKKAEIVKQIFSFNDNLLDAIRHRPKNVPERSLLRV